MPAEGANEIGTCLNGVLPKRTDFAAAIDTCPMPPISASTPTDTIASCSAADEKLVFATDINVIKPSSEPRTWRFLELRQKNASQLSLAKASELPLVPRINLHHAPCNSMTIEGKFDDWVRSIHS
jgi:hypothetical protein